MEKKRSDGDAVDRSRSRHSIDSLTVDVNDVEIRIGRHHINDVIPVFNIKRKTDNI